jgi:predicted KAP-like P-loop ATPase
MRANILHVDDNSVELLLERLPDLDLDAFKYKEIAMDIARVVRISKPPFVYAICGTWGTGKSTLLKYLLDFLSSPSTSKRPDNESIIIYFNAWHASIHSNFLAVLVKEIIDQINESQIIKQSKFKKDFRKFGKSLVRAAVKSFAEWNVAGSVIYSFFRGIRRGITDEFMTNLDANKEVKDKFNEISRRLSEKNLTAFVLIDELDRCSPHIVVKIIEAIRMIFGDHDELYYAARDTI